MMLMFDSEMFTVTAEECIMLSGPKAFTFIYKSEVNIPDEVIEIPPDAPPSRCLLQ